MGSVGGDGGWVGIGPGPDASPRVVFEQAAAEFASYVAALPAGRVLCVGIADSAIAKSRPLPDSVYATLALLGAPPTLCATGDAIGYRSIIFFSFSLFKL